MKMIFYFLNLNAVLMKKKNNNKKHNILMQKMSNKKKTMNIYIKKPFTAYTFRTYNLHLSVFLFKYTLLACVCMLTLICVNVANY